MSRDELVYQFKVELLGIDAPIWRRIQIPSDATFWDLHVAIQDAMGWLDRHLHRFRFVGSGDQVGIPLDEMDGPPDIQPGWEIRVQDHLWYHSPLSLYEYDFGDSWLHEVRFESVLARAKRGVYPCCVAGARRCPPEDCGGAHRYAEFLAAIADPSNPEHESFLEWIGGSFDPEAFDAGEVRFSDPTKRWQNVFGDSQR